MGHPLDSERIANVDAPETEVTQKMINAGADVLSFYDPRDDDAEEWAVEIYLAMRKVAKGASI